MTKTRISVLVLLVALVAAGLAAQKFRQRQSSQSIRIGVAAAQSGPAAEWGQGELRTVQLAIDKVNAEGGIDGKRIEIVAEDTKSDNVGTVNAISKLINIDRVPLIIGPTWGDSFGGGSAIAEKSKVVLLSPSTALEVAEDKENFAYLFSTWWPQLPEILALQRFMRDNKTRNVTIINDQDAFGTKMVEFFNANAKQNGLTIRSHYEVPIGEKDFRTTIIKTKQLNPDGVFLMLQDPNQFGPFLKQARELRLGAKVFSTAYAQNDAVLRDFGKVLEDLTYSYPKTATDTAYEKLIKNYRARYRQEPSAPSFVNAYNATLAALETLRNGARTGEEMRNELHRLRLAGVGLREIKFNERGQIDNADFEIRTIRNGTFVKIAD